jgi:uncharacterized membrane protein YjjP (DUF1212 family)
MRRLLTWNGGSWSITAVTFIAGMVAMFTRTLLIQADNPFITVIVTAFIASLIGATTHYLILHNADIAVCSKASQ